MEYIAVVGGRLSLGEHLALRCERLRQGGRCAEVIEEREGGSRRV